MKILIISSSTRPGRTSHRVALALQKSIEAAGHEATVLDLMVLTLPMFKERYDYLPAEERTESMQEIARLLKEAQAMIFLTPEYNGSISPGLKNLIDTHAKGDFAGKPIAVATASTGVLGGIRAAQQLQLNILGAMAYPLPQMLTVGEVDKQLDEAGEVINPSFTGRLQSFLNAFLGFVGKFA